MSTTPEQIKKVSETVSLVHYGLTLAQIEALTLVDDCIGILKELEIHGAVHCKGALWLPGGKS